ncbi:5-formyltetrahydrofolate cyclo-ligase [Sphingomonas koreensis]|nr:5-formyltetrahydrofolate cyclo-ligase [Sphingomonas koreensis]
MAVPPPPFPDKRTLRTTLRTTRDAFVGSGREPIAPPLPYLALLRPGLIVAAYAPMASEADPTMLARVALHRGCRLALPHVTGRDAPIRFLEWRPDHPLDDGPFGLRQPSEDRPAITPDIILTPLIGFDARFQRLGQGAGHYDRAFAALPAARRIGVAWSVQQVEALPVDAWDVPLHAVITESGWIEGTSA